MTFQSLFQWGTMHVYLERFCVATLGLSALLILVSYHPDAVQDLAFHKVPSSLKPSAASSLMASSLPNGETSTIASRIPIEDLPAPSSPRGSKKSSWLDAWTASFKKDKSSPVPQNNTTLPAVDQSLPYASVPMALKPKALFIQVKINNKATGHFILDTGATYTTISKGMARQLGLNLEGGEKIAITTANGELEVPKVRLKTVAVNGIKATDVEATVMDFGEGNSFAGLLGLSFIQHFKLTLDPKNGQMLFEPI